MPESNTLKNITTALRENHKDSITSLDTSNLKHSINSFKPILISDLNINESDWNDNREDISAFIKALYLLENLKSTNQETYNKLLLCEKVPSVEEIISVIDLPNKLSASNKLCRKIFDEIKLIKKSFQVNLDNILPSSTVSNEVNMKNLKKSSLIENLNSKNNSNTENINSNENNVIISDNSENISSNKIIVTKLNQLEALINKDSSLLSKIEINYHEDIQNIILYNFNKTHKINPNLIQKWIEKHTNKPSIEVTDKKPINDLVLLKEDSAEEIKTLYENIKGLNKELSNTKEENINLKTQIEDLTSKLNTYKHSSIDLTPKHIFSVEIKELNRILNSNSSESQIMVKDEILNRASKYIDKNSLINIEDILNENKDLKSEVVQIILLAFLHENSLL